MARRKSKSATLRNQLEVIAFLLDTQGEHIKTVAPHLMADYTAQSAVGGDPVTVGDFLVSLAKALRKVAEKTTE